MTYQIQPEDRVQKTWIPEGTEEYKQFKHVTHENNYLADFLSKKFLLKPGELLLDVGGREGDIAVKLQSPEFIHIVDPDPTLNIPFTPGKFWNEKVQNLDLSRNRYKLIIFSHILGYLGNQKVQDSVFHQLISSIDDGGTLVLAYNKNTRYMEELLEFSKENLENGHYDYFDEALLNTLDKNMYKVEKFDVSFNLDYSTFEDLSRCCWFLFGAMDQDIEGVANKFLPKLQKDLKTPTFPIEERITLITKIK